MKNPPAFFWLKLAFRELLNNRRFSLFFLFNLALGLAGFIALDSFKESLDNHLGQNSKAILGADIALTSYLPFEGGSKVPTKYFVHPQNNSVYNGGLRRSVTIGADYRY